MCDHTLAKMATANVLVAAVCTPTCKNSGTCVSPGRCQCSFGWTGSACTMRKHFGIVQLRLIVKLSVVMIYLCERCS